MSKRVLDNLQRKSLEKNIAVTSVARLSLAQTTWRPINEFTLVKSRFKSFADKSVLNRHLKAHDKRVAERAFACATCGETFHNRAP